jgi:fructose-specific phosphotransferase system component IIB
MFFCPICSYALDLSKTVPKVQVGGDLSDTTDLETVSEQKGGALELEKLIDIILKDNEIKTENVKGIDMTIVVKDKNFKRLTVQEKNKVFNSIQDALPKAEKKLIKNKKKFDFKDTAYFICKNCGFNKEIESETLIYSKTNEVSSNITMPESYIDLINDHTLPRTIRYSCTNKDCVSHTNINKKEAVFFRIGKTFRVRYICTACTTSWIS